MPEMIRVCGIVSQRDIFRGTLLRALGYGSRAEEMLLDQIVVKEGMRNYVVMISPGEPAADAARKMVEARIGCLPVVENRELLGLISETDFLNMVSSAN
ncbi:MAG: CBS domain-containing protein [Chromatiales bacterium]|jgi:CBS domain-containing protein|nr:CBS domain-containing protein [Chromatiales bacterium]